MKSWEIIEQGRGDYDRDMGFRSMEEEEAYKEGCRHGYRKAMMEMQDDMGERRRRRSNGQWY